MQGCAPGRHRLHADLPSVDLVRRINWLRGQLGRLTLCRLCAQTVLHGRPGHWMACGGGGSQRSRCTLSLTSSVCDTLTPPGAPGTAHSLIRASPPALGSLSLPGPAAASCGTCRRGRPPRPTARVRRDRRRGYECTRTRCSGGSFRHVRPRQLPTAIRVPHAPRHAHAHAATALPSLAPAPPPQAPTAPGSVATPLPPTPSTSSRLQR